MKAARWNLTEPPLEAPSIAEADMFKGYGLPVCALCACGGLIVSKNGHGPAVSGAVRAHQRRGRHRAWREREEV